MSKLFCKYCGKEITGSQISCWPLSGLTCYDCYYTKHRDALKEKAKRSVELEEYLEGLKPRDTIAWFLERTLGYKAELIDEKQMYFVTDANGNKTTFSFEKENNEWFIIFKGEGIEIKYSCNHLSPYHYPDDETEDNKLGFWYSVSDMKKFLKNENKEDLINCSADIVVAYRKDAHL